MNVHCHEKGGRSVFASLMDGIISVLVDDYGFCFKSTSFQKGKIIHNGGY